MTQYNLRLDEKTKQRAGGLAKKKGISENTLYQMAIEEFLSKTEASEFFDKLMKRVVSPTEKQRIFRKLRGNKADVLFPEDR